MGASKNDRKRSAEDVDPIDFEDRDNGAVKTKKRARVEERRSLFVRSLPIGATSETLTDFFSEHFAVKHAVVVVDQKTKESRGYGFVTFADAEDAQEAKNKLDKHEWEGKRIRLDVAEPRHRNESSGPAEIIAGKPPKKDEYQPAPKLIVRNLPWSIKTSEQLSNLFRSFGKVKFADLPQSKGKLKGFGFVTIRGKKNAEHALESINGKEIDGRTLAVDWAVDKETWAKQNPEAEEKLKAKKAKDKENEEAVDDEESATSEEEPSEDEASGDEAEEDESSEDNGVKPTRDSELDADLENFMKNYMQNMEEDDDDEKDDEDDKQQEDAKNKPPKRLTTDNSSTAFIRNLPFTVTDEQLKGHFEHFGKVRYARVVMDRATQKPAGTGFVCFFNADDARTCIKGAPRPKEPVNVGKNSILQDESADPDGKYTLDGRLLQVAQAVNKDEATNLADNSLAKRREKDKRRLFLLAEGAIDRNSPLFDVLTPAEHHMRDASAAQRKKLVQKNPSLHLSLTRLAIRNLPRNIGAKELKELGRKAVVGFATDVRQGRRQPLSKEENARDGQDGKEKDRERKLKGKGIIRQAKVVFESAKGTKVEETAGGKSRGYGFVEYTSHHWALMGLRYLNGQQVENENGKKQRLVVEFAIENAQVIQRRSANEEKSRQGQDKKKEQGSTAKPEARSRDGRRESSGPSKDKGKGRDRKGSKNKASKGDKSEKGNKPVEAEERGKPSDPKEDIQQRLIARKRLVRKKKAQSRGKN
ncbi:RNA recognition motif-containing protein [Neonectria magnoliae]|uniref:RNA recognition motif-containing protein n=1 Tax=Neonectria magnoliae TaxID=2732573 RepID=A0ABR1I8J7_9HYPO